MAAFLFNNYLRWSDGVISVGKEGEPSAFLTYADPEPFGIGYFGVCTGWGASGEWMIEGKIILTILISTISLRIRLNAYCNSYESNIRAIVVIQQTCRFKKYVPINIVGVLILVL